MALAITAALTGATFPKKVQVTVTGLTVGQPFWVTGSSPESTWNVRGATAAIATDTQVVLADIRTPLSVLLTYTVVHVGSVVTSGTVLVGSLFSAYLQSIDGEATAWCKIRGDDDDTKALGMRVALFSIPGRSRPVTRFDMPIDYTGQLTVVGDNTQLENLLRRGGLMLLRTDESMIDLPGADYLQVTAAASSWEHPDKRVWTLGYQLVDDPQPNTILPVSTWADFDTVYAASTWATFDSEWSTLTWADFDAEDWTTH